MQIAKLCYAERPWRRAPDEKAADADIYLASPEERAKVVTAAIDAGITFFHAAHEREAVSLGTSLRTLGMRDQITLSTTDGDALDRCPDTETGAFDAMQRAIARKKELLQTEHIDVFHLYDVRREVHTPARIAGAARALDAARAAGDFQTVGATCYSDYDTLADLIAEERFRPGIVIGRCNYLDAGATQRLFPLCHEHGITILAAQVFGWRNGISFVRFPNTWRLRNMTKNFTGHSAGQLHLDWVLKQDNIDGALISMQSPDQIAENIAGVGLTKVPADIASLFESFVDAIVKTREGWRGLLQDEQWEVRAAAESYLARD